MARSYKVFISYSGADSEAALTLRQRLQAAGLDGFLDRHHLPGSQPWQPRLETALADCGALVVLLGPTGVGTWQHREIQRGLDRQCLLELAMTEARAEGEPQAESIAT